MFKIGNFVNVFNDQELTKFFIAKIVGFDYDREVVFVDDEIKTYEVSFSCVEAVEAVGV
jgi:hypothetical protein